MSRIKSILASILLLLLSSLATVLLANFLLVYFSVDLFSQKYFPRAMINSLDGCYQTFYPSTHDKTLKDWIGVVGDSYGAGEGDEFLAGADDYGIFHKLRKVDHQNYLIFARGGFGSINAARELVQCTEFMNRSSLFGKIEAPRKIVVLFYEGNDLNDNIRHLSTMAASADLGKFVSDEISTDFGFRRKFSIYFPLYRMLVDSGRALGHGFSLAAKARAGPDPVAGQAYSGNQVALAQQAVRVPLNPQSAAVELSDQELLKALEVFYRSVTSLQEHFPAAAIELVYLPSVVTVYNWMDRIKVQSYQASGDTFTSGDENLRRSTQIRQSIELFSKSRGHDFVDSTPALRQLAQQNLIHGPQDWKHFNRLGYRGLAETLRKH